MNRPALLLPTGAVLVLLALLFGLGSVAAWRWGSVVDDRRWCGTARAGDGLCADRIDGVEVTGPFFSRRERGNEWRIAPDPTLGNASPRTVDITGDGPLRDRGSDPVTALVEHEERDVVALEVGGTVLPVNGVGTQGVLTRVGFGVMGVAAGVGCLLVGVRMRRDTGSWSRRRPIQPYGSAGLAVPVVLGFLLLVASRVV